MRIALVSAVYDPKHPPWGLAYLAAYLEKYAGIRDVWIVDRNFQAPLKAIAGLKPDLVGISCHTVTYPYAVSLARTLKSMTDAPLLVGGVHISSCPESLSRDFDLGILGEGERTLVDLARLFQEEGRLSPGGFHNICGLVYHDGDELIKTPPRPLIEPLDEVPFPRRDLLNKRYFRKAYREFVSFPRCLSVGIFTARGCPYRCMFCASSAFWKKLRLHSAGYVVAELRRLFESYDPELIEIVDDLFTVSKERVASIIDAMRAEGLLGRAKFVCQARANIVDEELCEMLTEMGVTTVCMGFESGSDRILSKLKGGSVTVADNRNACLLLKRRGIGVVGGVMFGSPGETIEDMRQSLDFISFLREVGAEASWQLVTSPMPGTRLWNDAVAAKKIDGAYDWRQSSFHNSREPVFLEENVSPEEFRKILAEARRRLGPMATVRRLRTLKRLVSDPCSTAAMIYAKLWNRWMPGR